MQTTISKRKHWGICIAAMFLSMTVCAQTQMVTYFHNDISGTPLVATDASGNVVWKENYRPYGERQNNQAGSDNNNQLWFTGKPYDPATGLSYMGARYYDPVLGRFMGVDPKGFDEANIHSFNRYTYANNNPYRYVDPDGRSAALAATGLGILVIGGAYYALAPPSKQQEMRESLGPLSRAIGSALHSESAEPNKGADSGTREAPIPGATGGERVGNGPRIWDKQSTNPVGDSNGDFDKLFPNGDGVSDKGNGVRVGTGPDGARVIVRPGSSEGSGNVPTIEIQNPRGKALDKIRYPKN